MMEKTKQTKIIAFEGIDGSGKGVQFRNVARLLEERGAAVGRMDFPVYDSFFGREIGRMLSGDDTVTARTVDEKSMSLWYAMDRYQAFLKKDLQVCDYWLLNRSTLSNAVYQSARCPADKRAILIRWIEELEFQHLNIPRPDLYVVFDVPTAQSERNVAQKGHRDYVGDKADVYEANRDYMSLVRDCYLEAASVFENAVVLNCMEGDRMKSVDDISSSVLRLIEERVGR